MNASTDIQTLKKFEEQQENVTRFRLLAVPDVITSVLVSEDG